MTAKPELSTVDEPFLQRDLVLAVLEQHAREQPSRTAVARRRVDGTFEETTYQALVARVRGFARLFRSRDGDSRIVPLCMGRSADAIAAMLGALVAGRAFCPVNPKLRLPQIERILTDTQASFLVVDGAGLVPFRGGVPKESCASNVHFVVAPDAGFTEQSRKIAADLAATASTELWDASVTDSSPGVSRPSEPAPSPDSVAACLFTSGSTGVPKGVLIGCADLLARARAELRWYGINRADVLLNLLPFSFDVGLNQMLCAVLAGAELVILDSWLPFDIQRVVEERRVTGISAVPSIWADFLRTDLTFDRKGAHRTLRYLTISGGDLSPAQHAFIPKLAEGVGIFKTYGQTEAFRATSLRPEEYAERPLSVGRPFSGVNVYVVREDGSRAQPGEIGEIVHTGLGVMLGYLAGGDPDRKLRENPFRGPEDDNERAIFTGDLGSVDEEGYLFLRGRRDELIKSNGNRVYPNEVKHQIVALPGVAAAEVVVARSDERAQLAAFIVPKAGVELETARVRAELAARLPAYMVPDLLSIQAELPRTASGKPDRPLLAARARVELSRIAETSARRRAALVEAASISGMERTLRDIARAYGTPCFVYFMDIARARVAAIRRAFDGRLRVSYAMKCNPHPDILQGLIPWVDGLDVSSAGELEAAIAAGCAPRYISFTGPAKQAHDVELAVQHQIGEVVLESVREARLLSRAAEKAGRRQRVLLRVAPARVPKGFGVNMAGRPCQFGVDEEDLDRVLPQILALPALELAGFHFYSGTQCLKPDAIAENYAIFIDIARRASEAHDLVPLKLILGSGLGIPYHEGDRAPDLDAIARVINPELDSLKTSPRFAGTELVLETGRYIMGEAGIYLTRVVNRKHSRGTEIAILDGGMHHHLGAAGHLGMALHRNYRLFKVHAECGDGPEATFDLYGPLCTTIDVLGRGVKLPGLEVGDVIGIHCSGAYGLTASPVGFISHPLPRELIVEAVEGRLRILEMNADRVRPSAPTPAAPGAALNLERPW